MIGKKKKLPVRSFSITVIENGFLVNTYTDEFQSTKTTYAAYIDELIDLISEELN